MAVVLVTAGLRGLGRVVAQRFADAGDRVAVSTRGAAEQPASGWLVVVGDPARPGDAERLVGTVVERFGRLDVLVNNAGPYIRTRRLVAETDEAEWQAMVEGNLSSAYRMVRAAIPVMRRQGSGVIVNVGFAGAQLARGWPGRGAYAAAKAGLASLTRTLAEEERAAGLVVVMACPSDIKEPAKELEEAAADVRRLPQGGDFAELVWWLAQPAAAYLTGAVVAMAPPFRPAPRPWAYAVGARVAVPARGAVATVAERVREDGVEWYRLVAADGDWGWWPLAALADDAGRTGDGR